MLPLGWVELLDHLWRGVDRASEMHGSGSTEPALRLLPLRVRSRPWRPRGGMSAPRLIADIRPSRADVCFGPLADSCTAAISFTVQLSRRQAAAIQAGEALQQVSCFSGRSSGRPAQTDGRGRRDAPCRGRQLPRKHSRRRLVRNPQSNRGSRGAAPLVASVQKGATSSKYAQAVQTPFCLDATTGQADRRR
jgi:hypothetical protein